VWLDARPGEEDFPACLQTAGTHGSGLMKHADWRGLGLLCFCLSAATLVQAKWISEQGAPPPLHPTIIEGSYKGKLMPIVAVSGESPRVEVDGKLKRPSGRLSDRYTPARGAYFAPGSLAMKDLKGSASKTNLVLMFSDGGEVSGGTLSARSDFSATVTPTQDYADVYIAIIFFDQGYLEGTAESPGATVQFSAIKPLVGGRENKVKLVFGYQDFGERRTGFFPLFFTHGIEIKSDQCEMIARFFRRREDSLHRAILQGYLAKHSGESLGLVPYLKIPPLLPDGTDYGALPRSISPSFMVNEEGRVESLQLQRGLPADVAYELGRTLRGWLFLPRLANGRPARTMVTLPIVLRDEDKPASTANAH
jgi:hypothetical protein